MPPELSSALGGGSRYPGTEFRLGGESDTPELSSTWEEKADSSGTEFRLGRRKQIAPELSSALRGGSRCPRN